MVSTMNIVDTMLNQAKANYTKRHFYSANLKSEVVQQSTTIQDQSVKSKNGLIWSRCCSGRIMEKGSL